MKRLAHYSQYFLRSPRLVKELIGHTTIGKNDVVYDIGAGSGVISAALSPRCRQVVAVEPEPRMAQKLRVNMTQYGNVKIYQGDFLTMPLPVDIPYKIFANIPFHLSSPIVRRLTEATHPPMAIYLIVQKQFANKLQSNTDDFTGQLGMMIGPWFRVRIRRRLQRTDFWPHPNVDTVLVELVPRLTPLLPMDRRGAYHRFTVDCFSDPAKLARLQLEGVAVGARPSRLTLDEWMRLFMSQRVY